MNVIAAVVASGLQLGLLASAYGFGFRHGIDWDHVAAITDITSSQETSRRGLVLATIYAVGHALVVFALGILAIAAADRVPAAVDQAMGRVVGLTLIFLGIYVVVGLVRKGRNFRMRSRWMLVFAGARRGARWLRRRRTAAEVVEVSHDHEHPVHEVHVDAGAHRLVSAHAHATGPTHHHHHRHVRTVPEDPFISYGRGTSFLVGMIHGVGAETPTQVVIFVTAAGAGGAGAGIVLLTCFILGLLSSNTAIAIFSSFGFQSANRHGGIYVVVSATTAAFSLAIGFLLLLDQGNRLPALLGG